MIFKKHTTCPLWLLPCSANKALQFVFSQRYTAVCLDNCTQTHTHTISQCTNESFLELVKDTKISTATYFCSLMHVIRHTIHLWSKNQQPWHEIKFRLGVKHSKHEGLTIRFPTTDTSCQYGCPAVTCLDWILRTNWLWTVCSYGSSCIHQQAFEHKRHSYKISYRSTVHASWTDGIHWNLICRNVCATIKKHKVTAYNIRHIL